MYHFIILQPAATDWWPRHFRHSGEHENRTTLWKANRFFAIGSCHMVTACNCDCTDNCRFLHYSKENQEAAQAQQVCIYRKAFLCITFSSTLSSLTCRSFGGWPFIHPLAYLLTLPNYFLSLCTQPHWCTLLVAPSYTHSPARFCVLLIASSLTHSPA